MCLQGERSTEEWLLAGAPHAGLVFPSSCASANPAPSLLRPIHAGAVAACGAPLVGWLAEHLGFDDGGSGGGGSDPSAADQDLKRAMALGDAIVICTALPWALCCLLYSGLHVTYPRDRRCAAVAVRIQEMVKLL